MTAQNAGQDPSQYANQATQYYDSLRSNGLGSIADQLSAANLEAASKILGNYAPPAQGSWNDALTQNINKDIYNAVQQITNYKGSYNTEKYGGAGNQQQYADAASPYYTALEQAGRKDIADYLKATDYYSTVDYLNKLNVPVDTTPPPSGMDTIATQGYGVINDYNNNAANGILTQGYGVMNNLNDPNSAANNILNQATNYINNNPAPQIDPAAYNQAVQSLGNYANSILANPTAAPGVYNDLSAFINKGSNSAIDFGGAMTNAEKLIQLLTQAQQPTADQSNAQANTLSNINGMYDLVKGNDANTTGLVNDFWGNMNGYQNDQTGRYDALIGRINNGDFYNTPAAQAIMGYYGQQGQKGANDATATIAAGNGGNIDSYSAANANRQNLAYLNAGTNAALNQNNADINNTINSLLGLDSSVNNLNQNRVNLLGNERLYANNLANTAAGAEASNNQMLSNQSLANNANIASGIGDLFGLYNTQSNNASADYASGISGYGNAYNTAMAGDTANKQTIADTLNNIMTNIGANEQANLGAGVQNQANALNAFTSLFGTQSGADSANLAAQLGFLGDAFNTSRNADSADLNTKLNYYNNLFNPSAANAQNQYSTDSNSILQKYLGELESGTQKYAVDADANTQKYITDINNVMNTANLASNEKIAELQKLTAEMQADLQYKLGMSEVEANRAVQEILANAGISTAEINANANITNSNNSLDAERYIAEINKAISENTNQTNKDIVGLQISSAEMQTLMNLDNGAYDDSNMSYVTLKGAIEEAMNDNEGMSAATAGEILLSNMTAAGKSKFSGQIKSIVKEIEAATAAGTSIWG
jgi:hypothetical protein